MITFRLFCITKDEKILDINEIQTNEFFVPLFKKLFELFCINVLRIKVYPCGSREKIKDCYWFYSSKYGYFHKACIQILDANDKPIYQPKFLRNQNIEVA